MNGLCRTLDCFYGTRFDPGDNTWTAIKVYRDGNPIELGGPFETEEEAEQCADEVHAEDLLHNSQFGMGA
jgi:hypothetical protein